MCKHEWYLKGTQLIPKPSKSAYEPTFWDYTEAIFICRKCGEVQRTKLKELVY